MSREENGLPEEAIDLGHDTFYTKLFLENDSQWVAIHEWHKCNSETWYSAGYVSFQGNPASTGHATWEVQSFDPLTLSPSLACSNCSHHGFISEGKWIPA